jgi:hypothetical protein
MFPPPVRTKALPEVLPIVKLLSVEPLTPKVMPEMSMLALLTLIEVTELEVNVAVSLVPLEPGYVLAPVLQLFSPLEAAQLPSVGLAFHVALAAWACVPVSTVARANPRGRSFFIGRKGRCGLHKRGYCLSFVGFSYQCQPDSFYFEADYSKRLLTATTFFAAEAFSRNGMAKRPKMGLEIIAVLG